MYSLFVSVAAPLGDRQELLGSWLHYKKNQEDSSSLESQAYRFYSGYSRIF